VTGHCLHGGCIHGSVAYDTRWATVGLRVVGLHCDQTLIRRPVQRVNDPFRGTRKRAEQSTLTVDKLGTKT